MATHEADLGQQLLYCSLKCAELSEKPVTLLQSLQSGGDGTLDLQQLTQLLVDVHKAAQQSAALASQLVKSVSPPPFQQPSPPPPATPSCQTVSRAPVDIHATPEAMLARSLMRMAATAEPCQKDEDVLVRIMSSPHGKYLQTQHGGQHVFANAFAPMDCSLLTWRVRRFKGGMRVALQNVGNGRWLCAQQDGRLKCDREKVLDNELWSLVPVQYPSASASDAGKLCFALLSHHGRFLSVEPAGFRRPPWSKLDHTACKAVANRHSCDAWEHLVLIGA